MERPQVSRVRRPRRHREAIRKPGGGKRRCPATSKVGFNSHRRAMIAVDRIAAVSERELLPSRAYRCWACRRWHLTSQPKSSGQWPVRRGD